MNLHDDIIYVTTVIPRASYSQPIDSSQLYKIRIAQTEKLNTHTVQSFFYNTTSKHQSRNTLSGKWLVYISYN